MTNEIEATINLDDATKLILDMRVKHFGEEYRDLPLTEFELKLRDQFRDNELFMFLGYRTIIPLVRKQLARAHALRLARKLVEEHSLDLYASEAEFYHDS